MELLGPGGVLERFNYAKLPRTAQYEVIKEVLWVAYKDTWRREDSIPTEKPIKHDYRKTMKFAIKVLQILSYFSISTYGRINFFIVWTPYESHIIDTRGQRARKIL